MAKLKFSHKFIEHFKKLNWIFSSDDLGLYFNKGDIRISIMYTGPTFTCYKNRKIGNGWSLIAKQPNLLTDKFVYAWMLAQMV